MERNEVIELEQGLAQCYGSEQYHKFSVLSPLKITDGVKYLCDKAGAYWLLDIIASYQPQCMKDEMLRYYQIWKLNIKDGEGRVTCERDTGDIAITQPISYTDFPLDFIKLICTNGVILLPSEN